MNAIFGPFPAKNFQPTSKNMFNVQCPQITLSRMLSEYFVFVSVLDLVIASHTYETVCDIFL